MTYRPMSTRLLTSLMSLLVLNGCGATSSYDGVMDKRVEVTQAKVETAQVPAPEKKHDPLQTSDSVWLGEKVVQLARGLPLPPEWERESSIALRSDNYLTLPQIASLISTETKIPIRLTGGAGGSSGASAQPGGSTPPLPQIIGQSQNANAGASGEQGMILAYEGPLSKLLDLVCGYFNVNWTYSGGSIAISRFETRTFVMDALPGAIALPSTTAQGSGGGSASAQPLSSPNIDIWNDIQTTLKSMVGTDGSIDVSQSSGTIVVSTTADRMERVSSYLSEENERLSRQVAITVDIFSVDLSDVEDYGMDLKIVTSFGGNWPSIGYSGITPTVTGGATLPFTIVEPGEIAGSGAIFKALSTFGKTTRVAQIPLTTLNNRPAVQNVGSETGYVSKSSTTTSDTSVTAEIETDKIKAGVALSVLPRIMADGRIFLQYTLSQIDNVKLNEFKSGSTTAPTIVQLPSMQSLIFSQQVMLKSGATLVLAGYDQGQTQSDASGVGRPLTWALGGGVNGSDTRKIIVIAITPREITLARPEAS